MPPASRGFKSSCLPLRFPIRIFLRTRMSSYTTGAYKKTTKTDYNNARKLRSPQYKSSPIEGRVVSPVIEAPEQLVQEVGQVQTRRRFIPPVLRRIIGNLFIAVPIIAYVIVHMPVSVMTVTGGSMRPFFNGSVIAEDEVETRDKMLVWHQGHYRAGDIERGEIVVFKTPHDPEKIAVKRVVALAGDRVLPLRGYDGSAEEQQEGVVVQYNHMWVEGDVDDRSKSVDSNWYGPISQNLVVGRASAILSPWYRPRWIYASEHTWPADEKRRVRYNAVQDAAQDPDRTSTGEQFKDGTAEMVLQQIHRDKEDLVKKATNETDRRMLVKLYQQSRDEVKRQDPETLEMAMEIVREVEAAFIRAGGFIEHPMFPEMKIIVEQEMARAREKEQEREQVLVQKEQVGDQTTPEQKKRKVSKLEALQNEQRELEEATERARQALRSLTGQA